MALGKTVGELKSTMSHPEFMRWAEFYKDFPFDDFHRYHRPAAIGAVGSVNMKFEDILDWLQKPQTPEGMTDVDMSVIKALGG